LYQSFVKTLNISNENIARKIAATNERIVSLNNTSEMFDENKYRTA
jgi:hypothetical protein